MRTKSVDIVAAVEVMKGYVTLIVRKQYHKEWHVTNKRLSADLTDKLGKLVIGLDLPIALDFVNDYAE